jgi:hypothetical protein
MPEFSAIYLPVRPPDKEDPSRSGFSSQEEAEGYVFSEMCSLCQEDRKSALNKDPEASLYPGCFYEWVIISSDKLKDEMTTDELMEAAGWKIVI